MSDRDGDEQYSELERTAAPYELAEIERWTPLMLKYWLERLALHFRNIGTRAPCTPLITCEPLLHRMAKAAGCALAWAARRVRQKRCRHACFSRWTRKA